ncbi:zinc finger protein 280C-like isoform X2 [Siniperca chuatsi]|nr:zinc finger protein 280C-like isoform X2 [Siniperca chuatsi]
MTSTGTCMQESTALSSLGHASASERDKQRQQDDVEHQSETTHVASEVDCLQDSFEEMEVTTIDEDECTSVKNRLSDLDSDLGNVVETTQLSAPGADDSCDEDVYVPILPQRSTTSELLLECEEEELEPWQKQTPHVHLKHEDDVGELSNDQTDCKPEPSLLQRNAGSTSPPKLKTPTPQPVVFNSQGFIVASPQLTSNTEFSGSLGTQRRAGNSFTIVPGKSEDRSAETFQSFFLLFSMTV